MAAIATQDTLPGDSLALADSLVCFIDTTDAPLSHSENLIEEKLQELEEAIVDSAVVDSNAAQDTTAKEQST